MFRQQRLFKLFDLDRAVELFRTVHRDELASFLKEIFGFSVELPSKSLHNDICSAIESNKKEKIKDRNETMEACLSKQASLNKENNRRQ